MSSDRTTRRPTESRARSASSRQIWSRVRGGPPDQLGVGVLPLGHPTGRRVVGVGRREHGGGELLVHGVQVVAQASRGPSSATCRRAAARRSGRPAAGSPSRSPSAKCTRATWAGSSDCSSAVSTMPSRAYAGDSTATRVASSSGTPWPVSRSRRASKPSASRPLMMPGQLGHHGLHPLAEEVDGRLRVQRGSAVVDQPPRGPLDERAHLDPHPRLPLGRDHVVVRRDLLAQGQRAEDLAGHEVGAGQVGRRGAGLPRQPRPEGHAGAVDEVVDHLGHDDLPAQRVLPPWRRRGRRASARGK